MSRLICGAWEGVRAGTQHDDQEQKTQAKCTSSAKGCIVPLRGSQLALTRATGGGENTDRLLMRGIGSYGHVHISLYSSKLQHSTDHNKYCHD